MKPSLVHRLVGFTVFSTLTIAAFSLKIVWWEFGLPATQRHSGLSTTFVIALLAIVSSIGTWKEKPWGYILAVLLCARENVAAVQAFYSQPVSFRFGDIFAVGLSGVPVAGGMIAAVILLLAHHTRRKQPNKAPEPTPGSVTPHADA